MSFIVCPVSTTLFRVEISNIKVELVNGHPDHYDKVWFRGNFDNYRNIVSPKTILYSNGEALFEDYSALFVYETNVVPPEMLVSKLFTTNVFGKSDMDFLGAASIDLLTLAAGPRKVVLRLVNGDSVVGRFCFEINMSDQTDTFVFLRELHVESIGRQHPLMSEISISWESNEDSKQRTKFVDTVIDKDNHNRCIMYPEQPHSIPMTLESLNNAAGLTFRVKRRKVCGFADDLGKATIMFVDDIMEVEEANQMQDLERSTVVHMDMSVRDDHAEPSSQLQGPPPAPGATDAGSVVSSNRNKKHVEQDKGGVISEMVPLPIMESEQRRFERVVEFRVETSGGQDNQGEQFALYGKVWLSKIPIYAQMIGGVTVEGVVCGGDHLPGNHPRPPFLEEEDSSV
jgi:hypothetical protein